MTAEGKTSVETPQTRCRTAIARCEITPPVGIYHRMWGAATHERATGVHRPLLATVLWLAPESGDDLQALLIVALDHCILDQADIDLIRGSVTRAVNLRAEQVLVTLAHTHAAGLMSRSRADLPGGDLIGPYLDGLAERVGQLATETEESQQPATILYGTGRCSLATHRDFYDAEGQQFVCGFSPTGQADDSLLACKIVADDNRLLGTVVNYACHPTTLAWQNTLISPDFIGAMRETIEQHTAAPCLFLQGASADLGPREGFVGDTAIADRNGRQLAFSALAALENLPLPGTRYVYAGLVVSGATIGVWQHEQLKAEARHRAARWQIDCWHEPLHYRPELPTVAETEADLAHWQNEEAAAITASRAEEARDCHARAERAERQLWRLKALPHGQFPLPITLARLGDALWLFVAGEHYQSLQSSLREQFPDQPIIVTTLTGGWQPGYIPPASTYGRGIYQEQIAIVAAGSAEQLQNSITQRLVQMGIKPRGVS